MRRRDFTKMTGLGALTMLSYPAATATNLFGNEHSGASKIPLGVCNHSLRSMKLNAKQLIEYAIDQKLDSVLLNTFQPLDNLESGYLSGLRMLAKSNNISIYIGAGSISEKSSKFSDKYGNAQTLLKEGIRVATALGSPVVGCRIGAIEERYMDGGIEAHVEAVIKVMKSLRTEALDAGIKFAFENHAGDLRSEELLALINETGTDICGALYDPANAVWAMEDPLKALVNLGPAIICTSIRDIMVWETDEGAMFQGMATGEGLMDYPTYAETMSRLCPGVPLHVETISNSARPVPFLNDEFWKGFPKLKAAGIIDFLNLAKQGKPLQIEEPPAGMTRSDFDISQQQQELLKSLDYLRRYCNAGIKSKG